MKISISREVRQVSLCLSLECFWSVCTPSQLRTTHGRRRKEKEKKKKDADRKRERDGEAVTWLVQVSLCLLFSSHWMKKKKKRNGEVKREELSCSPFLPRGAPGEKCGP